MSDYKVESTALLRKIARNFLPDGNNAYTDDEIDSLLQIIGAEQAIAALIAKEVAAARSELAITFLQQLDLANVPQEVKVPELIGDDLTRVSVPIVDGQYWVDIHKALKYIRETSYASLKKGSSCHEP